MCVIDMCVIDKCLLLADLAEWTDAHVADDDLDPLADHLFKVAVSVLR